MSTSVFGPFVWDGTRGELRKHGIRIQLRGQPAQILTVLLRKPGEVVTREELQAELWKGQTFVDFEHSLNAAVNRLRQALGDSAENPRYVETAPGQGYRFIAQVGTAAKEAARVVAVERELKEEVRPAVSERPGRTAGGRWLVAAALAMAAVVLAATLGMRRGGAAVGSATGAVAVLPFVNASGDSGMDYLSNGLTESLIARLTQGPGMKVIAASSAFRYKGQDVDPQKAAERLGAQMVVTGRVAQHGDSLQVWAELVDASTRTHLWGEHYQRKSADLLEVQEQIAREISEKVRVRLGRREGEGLPRRVTGNPEAYRLHLMGLFEARRHTLEGTKKALDYYQQAVALDPKFAVAYAGMTDLFANLGAAGALDSKTAARRAKESALKALEHDSMLAEAHGALAIIKIQEWEWADAESEFQRTLALNPNLAGAHSDYAIYLCLMGRFAEALEENRRARELSPLNGVMKDLRARILNSAGRYEEARGELQALAEAQPNSPSVHLGLAQAYAGLGRYPQAIEEYKTTSRLYGDAAGALIQLGYIYAVAGQREDALRVLERVKAAKGRVSPARLAMLHAGLGNKGEALELLERGFAERDPEMVNLKVSPGYDGLRGEPRFEAVLSRVGLSRKM